jgi:hypothetical protein
MDAGPRVHLPLTRDEAAKLLDLVGHDAAQLAQQEELRSLVRDLYRTFMAFSGSAGEALQLEVTD